MPCTWWRRQTNDRSYRRPRLIARLLPIDEWALVCGSARALYNTMGGSSVGRIYQINGLHRLYKKKVGSPHGFSRFVGPFHIVVDCYYPFHCLFGVAVCFTHFVPTVLTFKLFNWWSNLNYFVGLNGSQNCLTVDTNMNSSYNLVRCNLNKHNFIQLLLLNACQNRGECASAIFDISSPTCSSAAISIWTISTYIHTLSYKLTDNE